MNFSFNKTTANAGYMDEIFFKLKELLKSVGWIVRASSDGTTYNSTSDIITTQSSGAGGMANARSWYRITTPNQKEEFVFQRGTSAQSYRIKWSPLSKFIGGSPSATQVPSAGDEGTLFGAGTDASPSFNSNFGLLTTYRVYMGADADAPYGWYITAIIPGGYVNGVSASHPFFMYFDGLSQTETLDQSKSIVVSCINTALTITNFASSTDPSIPGNGTKCVGRIISSTTGNELSIGYTMVTLGESTYSLAGNCTGNPITNKEEILPIAYARRSSVTNPGFKGFSTTFRLLGSNKSPGDTVTVSSTRDRIITGQFVLPWDGSVPTV